MCDLFSEKLKFNFQFENEAATNWNLELLAVECQLRNACFQSLFSFILCNCITFAYKARALFTLFSFNYVNVKKCNIVSLKGLWKQKGGIAQFLWDTELNGFCDSRKLKLLHKNKNNYTHTYTHHTDNSTDNKEISATHMSPAFNLLSSFPLLFEIVQAMPSQFSYRVSD